MNDHEPVQFNPFPSGTYDELQKVSEYDQEIPQSHTADQPMAPRGRATKHL